MKEYSIKQVSELLQMPKDTLRYYDKLKMVSPSRGENRYRYYTERDILDLQYIETLKYADFSLAEIRLFLSFMRSLASAEGCDSIERLFEDKKAEYQQKIKTFKPMIVLVDRMLDVKKQIASPDDVIKANQLVVSVFNDIRGEQRGRSKK